MKKYFIRFECSGGSLAVEKHLHGFVRENYADHLVSEDRVQMIVAALEAEQDRYFETHRGQRVRVGSSRNYCTDGMFISAGQVSMTLTAIKGEI